MSENFCSGNIFSGDMTFIGQVYHSFQPLSYREMLRVGQAGVVKDHSIEFIALFKASDFSEEGTSPQCCQIEDFFYGKRSGGIVHKSPVKLGGLDGVGHGAHQRKTGASCDIAAKSYMKTFLQIAAYRCDS